MTTAPPQPPIRHGSYLPTDVVFLLTHINKSDIDSTDPATKETLIQSGKCHYSDMLTLETPVSDTHQRLYRQALDKHALKMATDIARLAGTLQSIFNDKVSTKTPLIIISLVRAGVPVGVLLKRTFDDWQLPACHYGVSIIRDRGFDVLALEHVVNAHPNSPIIFVDGWTGKGAIFGELSTSLANFCQAHPHTHKQFFHQNNTPPLVVLTDPAGVAWLSASDDDWLMPSSLLNSTISGLISRTLWRTDGFHGAVYYDDLQDVDESLAFINTIDTYRKTLATPAPVSPKPTPTHTTKAVIERIKETFNVQNPNRIKPTIAEATRAVLRRDPERVLVADFDDDTALLRHLCDERGIKVERANILPYRAMTIIKDKSQP